MASVEQDEFKNTILFFCPQGMPQVYDQIIESHNKENKTDFGEILSSQDPEDLVVTPEFASVLFCIQNKDDVVQLLTLCKMNTEKIRQGIVKVGGLNLTGSHKLDDVLKKSGVSDIFLDTISSKTLDYKINFWAKGIKTNLKKVRTVVKGNFNFSEGKPGASSGREASEAKEDIRLNVIPALNFSSDCWLQENTPEEPRRVLGHWVIDLIGPSPYAGRWTEIKNKEEKQDEDELWEWIPLHEEIFQFVEHEGNWVAKGKQPQFVWKTNSWKFMGQFPSLFFRQEGEKNIVRFATELSTLTITEDSKYARAKKKLIEESFDPKIVQKKEDDKSKANLENEDELVLASEKMANDIDEDEDLSLLAKKTAAQMDDLKGDLSGDVNIDPKHYKGKLGTGLSEKEENKSGLKNAKELGGVLKGKIASSKEADLKSSESETKDKAVQGLLKGKLKTKEKEEEDSGKDIDLKLDSLSSLANNIKKKREEEERKKKETSGIKNASGIGGLISGKFKTLKEQEEEEEKKAALRSEREHTKPKWGNTDLDLESDESQDEGRSEKDKKKSPFSKNSGIGFSAPEREGLKGLKREAEEREGRKHSGIGEGKEKEMLGKMGIAPVKSGDLSGSGSTDALDKDPMAGSQDGTDELEKFLHGKTAWKDELGGHLRLTKLNIQLTMNKVGASKVDIVVLSDIVDNLLVMNIPKGSYSYGQKAKVDVLCSYGALDLNFSVSGSIVDLYENDDETDCCNLELKEYNESNLKQLKKLFGDRQKNITNFFLQSKGIS